MPIFSFMLGKKVVNDGKKAVESAAKSAEKATSTILHSSASTRGWSVTVALSSFMIIVIMM